MTDNSTRFIIIFLTNRGMQNEETEKDEQKKNKWQYMVDICGDMNIRMKS